MPRYHFNIFDGQSSVDQEGTELPDIAAARREALRLSGAVIEEAAKLHKLGEEWRMEVTDDTGLLLFRFDFVMMNTSATASLKPRQS